MMVYKVGYFCERHVIEFHVEFCTNDYIIKINNLSIRLDFRIRDASQVFALNMAEDSVDDMYFGCNARMNQTVKQKYFKEEMTRQPFKDAWKEAENCATRKLNQSEDKDLNKDHFQAICVYTANEIYKRLNDAVRTQGKNYGSTFQFHTLHYLLTSAIQILNNNYHCQTTYRRSRDSFTGKVNQKIRFGSFTSSSKKTGLKNFGSETCFKIKTCSGAYLKNYSQFNEEEVLIPPYETFVITEIMGGKVKVQGLEDCEVIFVLESNGYSSRLNCKIAYP
ncbi:uncharacterized protein V6R79_001177 [Siganus canaliculatus]